jgi:preprotein translocase subunit SecG
MGLFIFLTVIQAIIAAALVGVVLMQRSEGGGLGIGSGGSPGGLMSARGAADFLTRTTKWLAVLFVVLAIVLAALAVDVTSGSEIDETLDRSVTTPAQADPLAPVAGPLAPSASPQPDPLVPGDPGLDGQAPVSPAPETPGDPLSGVAD